MFQCFHVNVSCGNVSQSCSQTDVDYVTVLFSIDALNLWKWENIQIRKSLKLFHSAHVISQIQAFIFIKNHFSENNF